MNAKTIKRLGTLTAAIAMVYGAGAVADTNTAGQDVGYAVNEIALVRMDGGSASLTITTTTAAEAGLQPEDVTADKTWAITSNKGTDAKKLTAKINTDMPDNVTLSVNVTAPSGGESAGFKPLSSSAVDVVTGIDPVAQSGIALQYKLHATVAAGVVASATKTVTYTLTDSGT